MTEQPDTAEIRAKLNAYGDPGICWFNETCYGLADALDAARAGRDRALFDEQNASAIWEERAEAAEAELARQVEVNARYRKWLNAARAELEDLRRDTYSMSGAGNIDHWCARAEAAEATLGLSRDAHAICCHERHRAEYALKSAEARINAALTRISGVDTSLACDVRRALTGDTERALTETTEPNPEQETQ